MIIDHIVKTCVQLVQQIHHLKDTEIASHVRYYLQCMQLFQFRYNFVSMLHDVTNS